MSQQNTRENKRLRSVARANRKHEAAKSITNAGVRIRRAVAKAHKYLRSIGLPHSKVADLA